MTLSALVGAGVGCLGVRQSSTLPAWLNPCKSANGCVSHAFEAEPGLDKDFQQSCLAQDVMEWEELQARSVRSPGLQS